MPKKRENDVPTIAPAGGTVHKGKPILVVEDEKPLARALELKLNHEGYQTHVSLNGKDGLNEALTGKYALILLDLIMPELDGFSLLQELRSKKNKIPVIVLSNLGQQEDKEKAQGLGVADYFVKANTPIVDIIKRVKSLIG
jgi:DNA-binding response OmpR family regulator